MFKKVLQITVTFALLMGAYQGYVLGFAAVSARLVKGRVRTEVAVFVQHESKTAKEATRFARETFGPNHWAANKDLKWRVYDADRGYFLYYQNYERLDSGKRVKLWPFAIIWKSKDGIGRKSAESKEAVVDLNEPLGILKPNSAPLHVVHAKLIGDVRMRDDKGTLNDPTDDLFVGRLTQIDYDEASSRIFTDSDLEIRDRNLIAYSRGLNIDLRRSNTPGTMGGPGFEARTATLVSRVHIIVKNVGATGMLPGKSKGPAAATPLDARCDGELRIDFPMRVPPFNPRLVGPPLLEGPTFAKLNRNVIVVRGDTEPDQLNSDSLRLTLVPIPKKKPDAAASAPARAGSDGPLTELTLVEANALGHAVWLQSKSQGVVARCNELIHNKFTDAPDETYLRADSGKQIFVEKVDPLDPAKPIAPRSVTTILAFDAKIFDDGKNNSASTVIARGPGTYENRPSRDKAVERSASWGSELIMRTDTLSNGETRRRLTINGRPKLVDHGKNTSLAAKRSIVASLRPTAGDKDGKKPADAMKGDSASQIEWMQAREEVVLSSPGRTMTARDQLDVTFDDDENPVAVARPEAPPKGIANPFGPVIATKPDPAKEQPKPTDKKAAELPVVVKANRVWAKIRQRTDGESPEILEALLRGAVSFHQDPAPGKPRGLDVTGEAVDITNQGNGLMKFKNFWLDPSSKTPATRLASNGKPEPLPPARIVTDERYIEGEHIGLDQKSDFAWAKGPGRIIQLVDPGLLTEQGLGDTATKTASATDKSAPKRPKVPFTIEFKDTMRFTGQSQDPKQRPSAKAEFRGKVKAWMDDALIYAEELDTYTDRPIRFDKSLGKIGALPGAGVKPTPNELAAEDRDDGRAQLSYIDARGPKVVVIHGKRDPVTRALIDKQRLEGKHISFDKSTGEFEQTGAGLAHMWRHRKPTEKETEELAKRPKPKRIAGDAEREQAERIAAAEAELGPWELIQITFSDRMKGRFGAGKDRDTTDPRTADFYGQVQTMVAGVPDANTAHDFDRPPADFKFLTADSLRVVDFPPPPDAPKGTPGQQTLTAEGNGNARDGSHTIAGDLITFDSAKELFHVYGQQGREVVIIDQKNPGLAYTNARGQAARYNHKTGGAELINPSSITLLDGDGVRAKPGVPVGTGSQTIRKPRPQLRPPPISNMERKGFSGR